MALLCRYMGALFEDSLGFAGCEMCRRVIGLAKVADITRLEDVMARARCEARVLTMARRLLLEPQDFADIGSVTAAARELFLSDPPLMSPVVGHETPDDASH